MSNSTDSYESLQAFLNGQQYTLDGIRRYEFIFGETYVSTGGECTTEEFVKQLNLKKSDRILDVGCGTGGSAFHIARSYGAKVYGVDLCENMITMAIKYQESMGDSVRKNVSFEVSDISSQKFDEGSFDVIYSRDAILHIEDKEQLFTNFFKWLKPGGKLMISDYCHGDKGEHSKDFRNYVMQRGYRLLTVREYGILLQKVGFSVVLADDRTKQFVQILHTELERFDTRKAEFLKEFAEQDFNYIVSGWNAKLERCASGDQKWGFFQATKPLV